MNRFRRDPALVVVLPHPRDIFLNYKLQSSLLSLQLLLGVAGELCELPVDQPQSRILVDDHRGIGGALEDNTIVLLALPEPVKGVDRLDADGSCGSDAQMDQSRASLLLVALLDPYGLPLTHPHQRSRVFHRHHAHLYLLQYEQPSALFSAHQ